MPDAALGISAGCSYQPSCTDSRPAPASTRAAGGAWIALLGVLLIGCSADEPMQPPPPLMPCPIGDLSAPAEIEIVHLDGAASVIKTEAMAQVPILPSEQGGWALLLGVRARNVDSCQIMLKTVLRDPYNNNLPLSLESRPTLLVVADDGWGVTKPSRFGNLPICPLPAATEDLHDVPYTVEVSIEDVNDQRATASLTIVPTCPESRPTCACECAKDYKLGDTCPST